jgi:MFS family permease
MFQHINRVVRIAIITDFFYNSAFASFGSIFAIFITNHIEGGNAAVAGFATSAYWLTKSVFQLPIARWLDRTDGETDEFWALFIGYVLSGLVPLGFLFATQPWHLYVIQAFFGFGMAWAVPAWYSIFTRHIDKGHVGFEWSLQSVFSVGIATAGAAALGGYIANRFGFDTLYLMSSGMALGSSMLLLGLRKDLYKTPPKSPVVSHAPISTH